MDSTFEYLVMDIERARAGDIVAARVLLHRIIYHLKFAPESPLPEPLRLYLIDAFREIVNPEPLQRFLCKAHRERLDHSGKDPVTMLRISLAELKREEKGIAKLMGDANRAFHLKKTPGHELRSRNVFHLEAALLHVQVRAAIEAGRSYEEAVRDVADAEGVSESTVCRAWQSRDQYHTDNGSLLARLVEESMKNGKDFNQAVDDLAWTGATKRTILHAWNYWKDQLTVSK